MTTTHAPGFHPVTAASRLLAKLARQGLAELVDDQTARDIEVAARFTIAQHTCACAIEEQTHIVGRECSPHPLHPGT